MKHYLGIDIGGTSIKYGLGNSKLGLVSFSSIPTPIESLSSFSNAISSIIQKVAIESPQTPISAIGIATPGTIEDDTGLIRGTNPNLKFWTNLSPAEAVPEAYREFCAWDNDANLMCLAEAYQYPGISLGITIGTGIGSGCVIDGGVYRGAKGFAMELGHISLEPDGLRCNCGLQGCLEAYSSVTAIYKAVSKIDSSLCKLSLLELVKLSETNSALKEIIDTAQRYLAVGIANAIICLDPDRVILGGGGIEAGLFDISSLLPELRCRLPLVNHHTELKRAIWGNRAGVLGAIIWAEKNFASGAEQNLH